MTSTHWSGHEFYKSSLVLGIDIGLSYIGIHLRLGAESLAGETVVFGARDSLVSRRQKRHLRRNRRAYKQRIFQLRRWCSVNKLPWLPTQNWQEAMERAYELRLKGEAEPGSLNPTQLVVCLRHVLGLRGYDWHRMGGTEHTYPWGDKEPLSGECRRWLESEFMSAESAAAVRASLPSDISDEDRKQLDALLAAAITRSDHDGLLAHLSRHADNRFIYRARNRNFPREVLEEHARRLILSHAAHFADGAQKALDEFLEILNYHRKNEAEQERHWASKAGKCPFTGEPRAPASNPDARNFRILEFLATRRFAVIPRRRDLTAPSLRLAPAAVVAWLLEQPAGVSDPLPASRDLRNEFESRVCGVDEKLASDTKTLNKDYFSQLRDLLYKRAANSAQRAAFSISAARNWYSRATNGGTTFEPADIKRALSERSPTGEPSFYDRRREAQLAEWFHPHVEFLLGARAYLLDGKKAPEGQVHGWINRLLVRPEIVNKLRAAGHRGKPDYVVIEVAGDIPRTADGRGKIAAEQQERRAKRDDFLARYELSRPSENQLLRAQLWEEQGGTNRLPARCPLSGKELSGGPLATGLEVAHIYPRRWGGPYLRDNLFLTTRATNGAMGDTPPARCGEFRLANLTLMRWSARKRELFTTPWGEPPAGNVPEWGFSTRVAQLARQLRDAMRLWMGLKDENEVTRRVGTVSGYITAQCRKVWMEGYRKDRSDLRNHLYDAMVISHIPPGIGINSAAFGGIFESAAMRDASGGMVFTNRPIAGIGPDWRTFEKTHQNECLVRYPRSSATKTKRYDETIYGVEKTTRSTGAGKMEKAPRLRVREVITSGGWPVKDAATYFEEASCRSPAFAHMFPKKLWEEWLTENLRRKSAGEQPLPLAAGGSAPLRAISVDASKPEFFDAETLAYHKSGGAKNPTERNIAIKLYEVRDARGRIRVESTPVLHPRFKVTQKRWREMGEISVSAAPLPVSAKLVCRIQKGDALCLPLKRDGSVAETLATAYVRLWVHVTAIKSSGSVSLKPCEFNFKELEADSAGLVQRSGSRLFGVIVKEKYTFSNASLLQIWRHNKTIPI